MDTASTHAGSSGPRQIFNHDIMGCTAEGVVGNGYYSGRALGATLPGDVIQLHPELKAQWPHIREHYRRVGLVHTEHIVWDVGTRVLADYRDHGISCFFFGTEEHKVRPDDAWFRTVRSINSKNVFMDIAERLGVPVPATWRFARADSVGEAEIEAAPYPCYLKAAVSVSGVGIHRCADSAALAEAIRLFESGTPVQIQQEVATDLFLNLQYEVTAKGLQRHAATEQVLDGCVHQGNRYPARHEPWDIVEPMAQWLYAEGMRGVFAFDVAVVEHHGRTQYLAIECNPRFNGASYPTAVAKKLGIGSWLARAFATGHRSLADLDLDGIEYDPCTGEGVILVNWGPILVGKLLVLLAGDVRRQAALTDLLLERL